MPACGAKRKVSVLRVAARGRLEDLMRCPFELDGDLGEFLRQPLASAQIDRRVGPAPVL
jgi:hypothetical protein